jgi:DNA-binding MarR family transcriptional regulator
VSRSPAADGGRYERIGDALDHSGDLTIRILNERSSLTGTAGFVLNRLRREGTLRLTTLALKEGTSQPSMTQLIQRLERQGLTTRRADSDDGRVTLVDITDAGVALLDERKRMRRKRLEKLMETLTPEESQALWLASEVALPILERLIRTADDSDGACDTSQIA